MRDGSIEIRGGRITRLIAGGRKSCSFDAGDVALLPGLVNAHVHLEFSRLESPLGHPGIAITDWIFKVVADRRSSRGSIQDSLDAVRQGLAECVRTGTVALGEIATTPWFLHENPPHPCAIVAFVERLGDRSAPVDVLLGELEQWHHENLKRTASADGVGCVSVGVSPHAPYSLSDALFEAAVDWSVRRHAPLAMHVAESRQELDWLDKGKGPFGPLFHALEFDTGLPPGRSPRFWLERLARAPRALIVHGNYLGSIDLDWIARHGERMHLVYCPRTHEFFGHPPWPMQAALARGINVAVGTDSRASNPDLSLWNELATIARRFPELAPGRILEMGTIGGATALGLNEEFGDMQIGKRAALAWMPCPTGDDNPLHAMLHDGESPAPLTFSHNDQLA
jgi:cytosine/adenosine deaminase-related metal-dependent hydrolase